jgi:hypothetical protein
MTDGLKCLLPCGEEPWVVYRQAQLVQPQDLRGDAPHVVVELFEQVRAHVRGQGAGKVACPLVEAVAEEFERRLRMVQLGEHVHPARVVCQLLRNLRSGKRIRTDGTAKNDYPVTRHRHRSKGGLKLSRHICTRVQMALFGVNRQTNPREFLYDSG